jgi:hypothetical protein
MVVLLDRATPSKAQQQNASYCKAQKHSSKAYGQGKPSTGRVLVCELCRHGVDYSRMYAFPAQQVMC